ncbi:MAG: hypothetical protein AABZ33_02840 [Chloroflexota bacterium]
MRLAARSAVAVVGTVLIGAIVPSAVLAHALDATFESRLPLVAYLAGAAGAVALSFIFVLVRSTPAGPSADDRDDEHRTITVPGWMRIALRASGLLAWSWILAQGIIGGSSDADVMTLFLWVYGWVGVAIVSAFIGPIWHWLDPFATLYDMGAWVIRRGQGPGDEAGGEARGEAGGDDEWTDDEVTTVPGLGRWPAVAGLALFIWLELAMGGGGRTLFIVVMGYTAVTLTAMALYGRDTWRSSGETFSVWFGLLGRMAPLATAGDGVLRRRGFAVGVLDRGWTVPDVVLIALGIGSILFDGLSQTQLFFDLFGAPPPIAITVILGAFLALVTSLALSAARWVGLAAAGAGLLPIAVGYLVAHYLTFLLIDGQRILVAISDPFQQGWDLFGTAFFEPSGAWLPPGLVWTFQLLAVVGGHMIGAWAGHAAVAEVDPNPAGQRWLDGRIRQIPLALVMVMLTTVTLWSLGQAVVKEPAETPVTATAVAVSSRSAGTSAP